MTKKRTFRELKSLKGGVQQGIFVIYSRASQDHNKASWASDSEDKKRSHNPEAVSPYHTTVYMSVIYFIVYFIVSTEPAHVWPSLL